MYVQDFNSPGRVAQTFTPDLAGLIAWLETQDGATAYDWMDIRGCVMCRFQQARGIDRPFSYTGDSRDSLSGPFGHNLDAYHRVCALSPWTFGAALSRARALQAERV